MPVRKTPTVNHVFVVLHSSGIDSVHASVESANVRSVASKGEGKDNVRIEVCELVGGTITVTEQKPAPKPKATLKSKVKEEESEEDEPPSKPAKKLKKENEADASAKPVKKTKSAAEQRAANADKPKAKGTIDITSLPDDVQKALTGHGTVFSGLQMIVTGVPPTIGRKNAERIVEAYGAKLMKSISKKTDIVVVGNDAGPKKLEQIADLGIETIDEEELIARVQGGDTGSNNEDEKMNVDDEDEEEPEEQKPTIKGKKAKK